jgi:hypothetical protein
MTEEGEINAISAVPSLWRIVLEDTKILEPVGHLIRWIEIGSQYMSGKEKQALRGLFPNAKIVQHYGLTEASRSTLLDVSSASERELETVGQAVGEVRLRIGKDGHIGIRGPHVAIGRLRLDGTIVPLSDSEGYFETKDLGRIEGDKLIFLGRADDQINISGKKISSEAIEAEINALVPTSYGKIGVSALSDPIRGEKALLAVEHEVGDLLPLISEAASIVFIRKDITTTGNLEIRLVAKLPTTETGKLQRNRIAELPFIGPNNLSGKGKGSLEQLAELSEKEYETLAVWQKVLGDIELSANSNFYDAGGDSLSSVQVGLAMEAAGMGGPAVRATLEGRSLGEVAGLVAEPVGPPLSNRDLPSNSIISWSVSMTRGLMVLSVLLSHWGPGLFNKLGLMEATDKYLGLIYRMGTPGFAAVFGVGVGLYLLPNFERNKSAAAKRIGTSFALVAGGFLLSAIASIVLRVSNQDSVTGQSIAHAFYSVLAYYSVALGALWFLLPLLANKRHRIFFLCILSLVLWCIWRISSAHLPPQQDSLIEWFRLMLGAGGYNIFKMTSIAALGASLGVWLSMRRNPHEIGFELLSAGVVVSLLCLMIMIETHGIEEFGSRSGKVFSSLAGQTFYVSFAATLIGLFFGVLGRWRTLSWHGKKISQGLIVFGGLALPIYVFHGLVIPVRDILVNFSVPRAIAMAIPLAAFLLSLFLGGRRTYRMYFS